MLLVDISILFLKSRNATIKMESSLKEHFFLHPKSQFSPGWPFDPSSKKRPTGHILHPHYGFSFICLHEGHLLRSLLWVTLD